MHVSRSLPVPTVLGATLSLLVSAYVSYGAVVSEFGYAFYVGPH